MTGAANQNWARALVAGLCGAGGITDVVVSPGSRSTPLVLAAAEHAVATHVVLDERSAAFFALGLARTSRRAVALVCTSGSAAGHYLPAVIEASASHVPLILLTADRPAELQGFGAGQTIDQVHLFGRHVRRAFHLTAPTPSDSGRWMYTVAALALDAAMAAPAGPVHINCPYRKPLWEPTGTQAAVGPVVRVVRGQELVAPEQVLDLLGRVRTVSRGAIVAGPAWPGPDADAVLELGQRLGWPVVAEPASQLRGRDVVAAADSLLRCPALAAALRPEFVLRLGRLPTSTTVQNWLAGIPAALVDDDGQWHDPSHSAEVLIVGEAGAVCAALSERLGERTHDGAFADAWHGADAAAWDALELAVAAEAPLWEGVIAHEVASVIADGDLLHVASSMPIRDLDGFARRLPGVHVLHSRGANGIDGTIATAAGSAAGTRKGVTVLLGDLAFRHDVASLTAAQACGQRVTLVVVDNEGGGIFAHLPLAWDEAVHERYFTTPQVGSIPALAAGFGVECVSVHDRAGLQRALGAARGDSGDVRVIHAVVDPSNNLKQHRAAWDAVRRAATSALGLEGER